MMGLPPGVLFQIAKHTDFENVMVWFHLNQSIRRYFMQLVHEIVAHVVIRNGPLPRWMTLPMLLQESRPQLAAFLHYRVSSRLQGVAQFVAPSWLKKTCMLSGGFMAQQSIGREWSCDLDIFTCGNENFRLKTKFEDHDVDFVQRTQDILTTMSGFDLSICQVGIEIHQENFLRVYCTPLFLYSLHYHRLVWRVMDLAGMYLPIADGENHVLLTHVYKNHIKFKHNQPFHTCRITSCLGARGVIPGCPMKRWYQRVDKYVKRFPDWSVDFYLSHP